MLLGAPSGRARAPGSADPSPGVAGASAGRQRRGNACSVHRGGRAGGVAGPSCRHAGLGLGSVAIRPSSTPRRPGSTDSSEVIDRRTAASLQAGVQLRFVALAATFELGRFDVDVVLACLAPELDRRYGRLYGYLHDDITRQQPTPGLILDLFCPDLQAKVARAAGSARRRRSARASARCSRARSSGSNRE